jgi:hypothetical protein
LDKSYQIGGPALILVASQQSPSSIPLRDVIDRPASSEERVDAINPIGQRLTMLILPAGLVELWLTNAIGIEQTITTIRQRWET